VSIGKKAKLSDIASNEMELVDFRIFKQHGDKVYQGIYGVNVAKVNEIIRLPKLTELPGVPSFVEGIFDLRGVVIPVINLAKWMGVEVPKKSKIKPRVIIAEFNNIMVGFVVHQAKRIRRINWGDIEPATFSTGDGVDKSKITGVTRIEGNQVLLILDLESVVQELGFFQPNIELKDNVKKFSGLALVLDDSSIARKIVKGALERMGFKVVEAIDGQSGIHKLEELYNTYGERLEKELKIIISDVEMPKMDGFHFAAKVKEDSRFSKIPIIFSSSISDQFTEEKSVEAGGEAYLVKFDANVFYKEVSKVLEKHSED